MNETCRLKKSALAKKVADILCHPLGVNESAFSEHSILAMFENHHEDARGKNIHVFFRFTIVLLGI